MNCIASACHVLSLPIDKIVSCVPCNVVKWMSFSLRISTTSGSVLSCSISMHILQTATRQLFKGMACHPDAVFPSHSLKVTYIIKATPSLPSSKSPGTSYISGVMELAPLSLFLKITYSPPGIISDKFRHKPIEYSPEPVRLVRPWLDHSQPKLRHNLHSTFVWSRSQTKLLLAAHICNCAGITLSFSTAKVPYLPGEPHQPVSFPFPKRLFGWKIALRSFQPM